MESKFKFKLKRLSILQQVAGLKSLYPKTISKHTRNRLIWIGALKPTPISSEYTIKIEYTLGQQPKCYSYTPLTIPKGKKLPHVYNQKEQQLCLYYPRGKNTSWDASKSIAFTIIPWASEWLFYYELWLATGQWLGGGIHVSNKNKEL